MQRINNNTKRTKTMESIGDIMKQFVDDVNVGGDTDDTAAVTATSAVVSVDHPVPVKVAAPEPSIQAIVTDGDDDDDELSWANTKYELSLAEFPVFLLSSKIPKDIEAIYYSDVIHPKGKAPVERQWQVTWSKKYGPPTQSVSETFFALYQIWAEAGFDSSWIHFNTIAALLKRKGLSKSNVSHNRTIRDLKCLCGIVIEAKNAFYDTEQKKYVDRTFHLFEEIVLTKNTPNSPDPKSKGYIKASKLLLSAARKGSFLFGISEDVFFKLPGIQQRLCLYLQKMFRVYKTYHIRNIDDLAAQIPLLCSPRLAKYQLKEAAKALIKAKVIPSFTGVCISKNTIRFDRESIIQTNLFESIEDIQAERDAIEEDNYKQIMALCRDKHSETFYRIIAAKMDSESIHRAIAETKEFIRTSDEPVRSVPKVFVSRIMELAEEQGIRLTSKKTEVANE